MQLLSIRRVITIFLFSFICPQLALATPLPPPPQKFIHLQPDYDFGGDIYQQWVRGVVGERSAVAQVLLHADDGDMHATARAYASYSYYVGFSVTGYESWQLASMPDFDDGVPYILEWYQSIHGNGLGYTSARLSAFGLNITTEFNSLDRYLPYYTEAHKGEENVVMLPGNFYNVHLATQVIASVDTGCIEAAIVDSGIVCVDWEKHDRANYYAISDPIFSLDPEWEHYDKYKSLITINEALADVTTEEYGSRREAVPPAPIPAPAALWLLCIGLFALRISHGRKA